MRLKTASNAQRRFAGGESTREIKKKSLQAGDAAAPIAAPYDLKTSDNSISNLDKKVNTFNENSFSILRSLGASGA